MSVLSLRGLASCRWMGLSGQVGISRSPFPGPSVSVFRDAWAVSMSPRASHFPYFTHCHLEQKGPFPKQSLKTSRQLLFNTQDPSPALCPGATVLPPSRDEWVTPAAPHCVGGSSGASNVLPHAGLESISSHSHVLTQALPLGCPLLLPPPTVSFTAGQPCSISLWVRLSPHTSSAPQQSGSRPPLHPIPAPPPHLSLPPHSCAE